MILLEVATAKNIHDFSLFLFNHGFEFQDFVCHDCHDLSVNIGNITIITIKNVDYCCIIHNINKSEAINLLENSVLEDCRYL